MIDNYPPGTTPKDFGRSPRPVELEVEVEGITYDSGIGEFDAILYATVSVNEQGFLIEAAYYELFTDSFEYVSTEPRVLGQYPQHDQLVYAKAEKLFGGLN